MSTIRPWNDCVKSKKKMITSKKFEVEGKEVIVYDGIFTAQETFEVYLFVENREYRHHNLDNLLHHNKQVDVKWSSEIHNTDRLFDVLLKKYSQIPELQNQRCNLIRTYVNFAIPDTVDLIHDDAPHHRKNHYTLLHYANWKWDVDWHGETVFYDSNCSEILLTTTLKPGRVVMFDSSILHCARPPSKIAEYPRYTIAYKFSFVTEDQNEC